MLSQFVMTVLAVAAVAMPSSATARPLRLVMIDADGGAAVLFVTPEGKSLLVDTGWPTGMAPGQPAADGTPAPRPPAATVDRIVAAMQRLGVTKLDHLLITHYHLDHVGGVHDVLARVPVGQIIDHGFNREAPPSAGASPNHPATLYARYEAALSGRDRRMVKVGDVVRLGSLTLTIVAGDGKVLEQPLPGVGRRAGLRCDTPAKPRADDENTRSLGFVASYGRARILDLGDLTWDEEKRLVCPRDTLGAIDVLLVTHHGSEQSSNPALVHTTRPRVALVANGARKGGDSAVFATLAAAPSKPAIWYGHTATRSPDANPSERQVANLTVDPDGAHGLDLAIETDATVRVTNMRTGETVAYPRQQPQRR